MKAQIPKYISGIAKALAQNGFEAYLVGGSLRDIVLEKIPGDFDIATNAYPQEIESIFPKSIPTGAKFGTITVIVEDESGERFDVEVTTYRSDADYLGGRWPARVDFAKTITEDLSRRDFAMNAMALDLVGDRQLYDPFGGMKDISEKVIRAVGDPIIRFSEDGLRAVRATRFASVLGFEIEKNTFDAIKKTNHITKLVSIERFREEFEKILYLSSRPSVGINLMKETGILQIFIPELLEGIGIVQPKFHEDDVYTHLLKACDFAEDRIKLSALFHDIAKPRTKTEDEKGIHFYGHDVLGGEMAKDILKRLRFSGSQVERVSNLVRWHMFHYPSSDYRMENPHFHTELENGTNSRFGWTDGAIRRLIKNVGGEEQIEDLLKLRVADATSNPKNSFNPKEIEALASRISEVRAKEMAIKVTDLDIDGNDLINEFEIYGKNIGETLNFLLEKVMDEPILNRKKDLLKLAKDFLNTH